MCRKMSSKSNSKIILNGGKALKRLIALLSILIILFSLCGCTSNQKDTSNTSDTSEEIDFQLRQNYYTDIFDTIFTFLAYTDTQSEFDELSEDVHSFLLEYHKLYDVFNKYDGFNNLRTINENAGIQPVEVDQKIIDLLLFCRDMTEKTKGTVDVTYGRIMSLWHTFIKLANDEENPIVSMPNDIDIQKSLKCNGWDKIVIDDEKNTVFIKDSMVLLDVGAIAKGYAVQKAAEYIKAKNIPYAVINMGGNVTTIGGRGNDKDDWVVGIADPENYENEKYMMTIGVKDKSVVTSGDYERYYIADDNRYCHIIDLSTGYPANTVRGVTVVADDSGFADALSTALFVMPVEEGQKLVESIDNVEAIWILQKNKTVMSSGFKQYVLE